MQGKRYLSVQCTDFHLIPIFSRLPVLHPLQRDTVPQSRASHFNLCTYLPSSVRIEVWHLFAFVYWKSRAGATTTFFFSFKFIYFLTEG